MHCQPSHVALHALLHAQEGFVVSGPSQVGHIGLGVALVATLEMIGEGDVLNLAALVVRDDGVGHIVKALGTASAAVVDAADLWVVKQPEVDGDHIVDVDEIALLAAGAVAVTAFKQAHSVAAFELLLHVVGQCCQESFGLMAKRVFDWLASSLGLLLLAPVLVLLAFWIKLDSQGPVFFRQERVGMAGRTFKIHKFRTMVTDAEKKGLQITVGTDARVTRVGHWLRKYKLDELPQLLDVWLGRMSLVGPRPEVPRYVACYPADVRDVVLSVRPGITDRASIEFRDENEILGRAADPHTAYVNEVLPIKLRYYVE